MDNCEDILSELFRQKNFPDNPANSLFEVLANRKLILYGAGDGFITFSVFVMQKYGIKASAVLDRRFKTGDEYCGVPAFSPFDYAPADEEKKKAVIVVTVGKKEYHQEIFECLHGLGFSEIVLASDIYEYHLLHTPPELDRKGFGYYLDNQERIEECLALFSEDLSREVFVRVLQTHMQRKPVAIPARSLEEQYFPKDIALSKGYDRFINCGAYTGDTVSRLNFLFGKIDALACFEPDSENYAVLTKYMSERQDAIAHNIVAIPCGVFSHETQLRFASGNRINSIISETGDSIIQCVTLDHALPGFRPTFIDMDIEGAEPAALRGAETMIGKNRPDLGICVYHAPNHLWDIPLYLAGLRLGYKFYLRNYTGFISETVLYATT